MKSAIKSGSDFVIKGIWCFYIYISTGVLFGTGMDPIKPFFIGLFIFSLGLLCDFLTEMISNMIDNDFLETVISLVGLSICILSLIFSIYGLFDYVKTMEALLASLSYNLK